MVVPFIPKQIDKVESYLHTGVTAGHRTPDIVCADGDQPAMFGTAQRREVPADLSFSVRHQQRVAQVQESLKQLTSAVDLDCFKTCF